LQKVHGSFDCVHVRSLRIFHICIILQGSCSCSRRLVCLRLKLHDVIDAIRFIHAKVEQVHDHRLEALIV
jgi:hypothetical protein